MLTDRNICRLESPLQLVFPAAMRIEQDYQLVNLDKCEIDWQDWGRLEQFMCNHQPEQLAKLINPSYMRKIDVQFKWSNTKAQHDDESVVYHLYSAAFLMHYAVFLSDLLCSAFLLS